MKKLISIIFTVALSAIACIAAGCEYMPLTSHRVLGYSVIDYEQNDYAPVYGEDGVYSSVYRLTAGKQYYIQVYYRWYYTRGDRYYVEREEEGQYLIFTDCFKYDPEEVEISHDTNNPYKAFPMQGLKGGSAIIEYDSSEGETLVWGENYFNILIVFE